jgi:hypothetical protein
VTLTAVPSGNATFVSPEECQDTAHREVWSPLPSEPGRYTVELRVLDPRGQELRVAETDPLTT